MKLHIHEGEMSPERLLDIHREQYPDGPPPTESILIQRHHPDDDTVCVLVFSVNRTDLTISQLLELLIDTARSMSTRHIDELYIK